MQELGRDLTAQLGDLLGDRCLLASDSVQSYSIGSFSPVAVVQPADAAGVSSVLQWASGAGVAVYPVGGRTQWHLGNRPARPGIAMDMTGLNRMVDFQPADLTVRVQAGMTVGALDAALWQDGKCVPLAPPLSSRATIGGTLATGISGPMRAAYGLPRDWLIGIDVVGPDGTASKAGGQVVKNVTGYDLNRLYTGSLGTLAVITEATFKIAPAPTAWAAIVGAFETNEAALAACRDLVSQHYAPQSLHLMSPGAARRLEASDLPVGYGPVAIALIAGRPASVKRRVEETALLWLDDASTLRIEGEEAGSLAEALADLPVDPGNPPSICVRLNTAPAYVDQLMMESHQICGVPPQYVADVGFGGGRLMWWDDFGGEAPERLADALRSIQAAAHAMGGDAIVERCPEDAKNLIDVWGPEPSGMEIMRRVKRQFDPGGVLNPGRFIGGL